MHLNLNPIFFCFVNFNEDTVISLLIPEYFCLYSAFSLTEYGPSVTIVTNPERGFLNHQKHTSIDMPRVLVTFQVEKRPKYLPTVYG